jgi:divalent metal cation (Fe/Co/Zn/Cd) transporter
MIGSQSGMIWAVIFFLVAVGTIYNLFIAWVEKRGYLDGFTSLAVAGGVVFTLIGIAVIDWKAALLCLVCFVASGTPMIIGSLARYVSKREQTRKAIKEIHQDDRVA